ncbi:hypothetical protein EAO71_36715 [Streptomyces sp. ms191]|nr:hypothetical protein EAO71_36715 [Streptomyces sp. ms191]
MTGHPAEDGRGARRPRRPHAVPRTGALRAAAPARPGPSVAGPPRSGGCRGRRPSYLIREVVLGRGAAKDGRVMAER